jgi:protocatechuate 3,4-dioxygenase, alpha subunit
MSTGSQTIGPYFAVGLTNPAYGKMAGDGAKGERIRLALQVLDGEGTPVTDAMLELWQADAAGRYEHPDDPHARSADAAFCGFGRLGTDAAGVCVFDTVKPGRVAGPDGRLQAPHVNLHVFARGILWHVSTRVYFAGEAVNEEDTVLKLVPEDRRGTLLAHRDGVESDLWRMQIHLCGPQETVFLEA